jgi:hypothetical protein
MNMITIRMARACRARRLVLPDCEVVVPLVLFFAILPLIQDCHFVIPFNASGSVIAASHSKKSCSLLYENGAAILPASHAFSKSANVIFYLLSNTAIFSCTVFSICAFVFK